MNILYIALLLCVVHHVFASESDILSMDKQTAPLSVADDITKSSEAQEFAVAVQIGDIEAVVNILRSCNSDKLQKHCLKHLGSLRSFKLIELVNGACDTIKTVMLVAIFVYADDQSLFDEVSAGINHTLTEYNLGNVASHPDLVCNTDRFMYLLGKLAKDKVHQILAVEKGVRALVHANKPEDLDHLLNALESEKSLDTSIMDAAIREVFWEASCQIDDRMLIAKNFFDNPAIDAVTFSSALRLSYKSEDPKHELFYWLLAQADRQDLEQVEKMHWLSEQSYEFVKAVNKTLEAVGPDTRIGIRRRRVEPVLTDLLPKVLLDIIFGYHFGW